MDNCSYDVDEMGFRQKISKCFILKKPVKLSSPYFLGQAELKKKSVNHLNHQTI